MDEFLLSQLRAARSELGLSTSPREDFNMDLMSRVFRHNIDPRCLEVDDHVQCFIPIEKCAHSSVEANFKHMAQVLNGTVIKGKKAVGNEPTNASHYPAFTFVRDPMEHFTSGFAENVMWQDFVKMRFHINNKELDNSLPRYAVKTITVDHAEMMLDHFFSFNRRVNVMCAVEHMFTMSGVLFGHDLDVVGSLDRFKEDWEGAIQPKWHLQHGYKYNPHLGVQHRVSTGKDGGVAKDPQLAHQSIQALFAAKPQYFRAICQFILIDYVCLPHYSLPEQCAYLNRRVEEGRKLLQLQSGVDNPSITDAQTNPDAQTVLRSTPNEMIVTQHPLVPRFSTLPHSQRDKNQLNSTEMEIQEKRPSKCYGVYNRVSGHMNDFLSVQVARMLQSLNRSGTTSGIEEQLDSVKREHIENMVKFPGLLLFPKSPYFPGAASDIGYVRMLSAGSTAVTSNILASISPQYDHGYQNSAARYRSLFSGSSEFLSDEKQYKRYLETRQGSSSSPQEVW